MTAYIFIYLGFTEAYKKFFFNCKDDILIFEEIWEESYRNSKGNSDIKIIDSTVFVSWISSFKISL